MSEQLISSDNTAKPNENEEDDYYSSGLFDIETSPAFKILDALKERSDVEPVRYREQFLDIYKFMNRINGYQRELAKQLKSAIHDVTIQRLERDRQISKHFSGNAEIGELKRELLKAQNEVNLALDRESKLASDIEDLNKQKADLIHDIEEVRRHKADMLEPQLIAATKELKLELMQRRNQVENLQKDMDEKQAIYETAMQERDRLDTEREKHALILSKSSEMPIKILKQIDVLRDALTTLSTENAKQGTLGISLDKELVRLSEKKKTLEDLRLTHAADYEQRQGLIHEMEKQVDDIFKEHELAKEQLAFQKAERVRLDVAIRKTAQEIKKEHDLVLRVIREKDTYTKMHARLEIMVANIKLSTPALQKQAEEFRRQLENVKSDQRFYKKEIDKLKEAIDQKTLEYLRQDRIENQDSEALREQVAVNRKISAELEDEISKLQVLTREDREVIRAKNKLRALKNDLAIEDLQLHDSAKRTTESQNQLKEMQALYEKVKNERNKYVNQIQSSSQRAAEMKEKLKILANEIEILRHEIFNKDKDLSKRKQENSAKYAMRDALQNEDNKLHVQYKLGRDQITQHLSRIEALNAHINETEDEMVNIKSRYEAAIKERNKVGMYLLDRNDELCILYERLNLQKEVALKGEHALVDREDEIRKLTLIGAEIQRQTDLEKQKLPQVTHLQKEVEKLEAKRLQLNEKVRKLGALMENPNDPNRCRNLPGKDPAPKDLVSRIEHLQEDLAAQEEKLLEKDLILEEVATLVTRLQNQTLEGKDETCQVSQKLNQLNKRLKVVTRKTMAKVSELAMHQAKAMSLYQEKNEKALLGELKSRHEKGDIPTEEIEKDFIKLERQRAAREREKEMKKQKRQKHKLGRFVEIEDGFYVYGRTKTTAEPRPNAYIPDALVYGELPIPKPYGENSPFKPQVPGAVVRYYKKSAPKPIEL